jgi:hypothetical protein
MDVRRLRDGVLALADLADDRTLVHDLATLDRDAAQLEQRDRKAVGSVDRHGPPTAGHRTCERDRSRRRRMNGRAGRGPDVDAAVLARPVRVRERERPQHGPVGGPGPAGRGRNGEEGHGRSRDRNEQRAPHRAPPSWTSRECSRR